MKSTQLFSTIFSKCSTSSKSLKSLQSFSKKRSFSSKSSIARDRPSFWDDIAAPYDGSFFEYFTGLYLKDVMKASGLSLSQEGLKKVLDVGTGTGSVPFYLIEEYTKKNELTNLEKNLEFNGIDFSPEMIRIVSEKMYRDHALTTSKNFSFQLMDGHNLSFGENTFHNQFANFSLMFFADKHQGLKEMYRTLKPSGKVVITTWNILDKNPAIKSVYKTIDETVDEKSKQLISTAATNELFSLSDKDELAKQLKESGFTNFDIQTIDKKYERPIDDLFEMCIKGFRVKQNKKKLLKEKLNQHTTDLIKKEEFLVSAHVVVATK